MIIKYLFQIFLDVTSILFQNNQKYQFFLISKIFIIYIYTNYYINNETESKSNTFASTLPDSFLKIA